MIVDLSWKVEVGQHDRPHGVRNFIVVKRIDTICAESKGKIPAIARKYTLKGVGSTPTRGIVDVIHSINLVFFEMCLDYLS